MNWGRAARMLAGCNGEVHGPEQLGRGAEAVELYRQVAVQGR